MFKYTVKVIYKWLRVIVIFYCLCKSCLHKINKNKFNSSFWVEKHIIFLFNQYRKQYFEDKPYRGFTLYLNITNIKYIYLSPLNIVYVHETRFFFHLFKWLLFFRLLIFCKTSMTSSSKYCPLPFKRNKI